jgi:nickel-dependent lactate racemase
MATFALSYGYQTLSLRLPPTVQADCIEPAFVPPAPDPLAVVRASIRRPVDGRSLSDIIGARDPAALQVAIAINDKTRPVPHEHLLLPLVEALQAEGIPSRAITFLIATGTHPPMPPEEYDRVLPREISQTHPVVSHNCDDLANLIHLGTTSRGTVVNANRLFCGADIRIVVGNIEPHHFAGFSGGYKTASIGLTGRETINHNHAMLVEPGSRIATFEENPLRQDIEEIGDLMGVDFAVNAILNSEKKIVEVISGGPRAVMHDGIPISRRICQVQSPPGRLIAGSNRHGQDSRYDLVIASVGGAPKDINFYQSQKALTHASLYTRDGGVIILVAECPEGPGSSAYVEFMRDVESIEAVFAKFRAVGFRVGPHKAFQVARDAARVHIILVSSMPAAQVRSLLMTPAASLDEAVAMALEGLTQPGAALNATPLRAAVLPRATNTVPAD